MCYFIYRSHECLKLAGQALFKILSPFVLPLLEFTWIAHQSHECYNFRVGLRHCWVLVVCHEQKVGLHCYCPIYLTSSRFMHRFCPAACLAPRSIF